MVLQQATLSKNILTFIYFWMTDRAGFGSHLGEKLSSYIRWLHYVISQCFGPSVQSNFSTKVCKRLRALIAMIWVINSSSLPKFPI